ncbi:MAG: helix-turn-helix domain-containing protein, partial [Chryseosolibacter sp.]
YFLARFSLKTNKRELVITPSFLKSLERHPWKGNISELKNVIERSVILADHELTDAVLPWDSAIDEASRPFDLASIEKSHIRKVLHHTGGNKTQAAKLLGIGLTTLYQKIKDYHL